MVSFYKMCPLTSILDPEIYLKNDKAVIFDIDYCLYSSQEMHKYERELVRNEALKHCDELKWKELTKKYSATKELFNIEFGYPIEEFHKKFENPNINEYLKPDNELNELIKSLDCRKFCFTNGCKARAEKILNYLGLYDIIEAVICCDEEVNGELILKPKNSSFNFVKELLQIKDPGKIYFFDDKIQIIEAAAEHGWNAYHIQDNLLITLKELINQNRLNLKSKKNHNKL